MKTTSDSPARQQKKFAGKRPQRKDAAKQMPIPDKKAAPFLKSVKGIKGILQWS